jgi:hypothetical protein
MTQALFTPTAAPGTTAANNPVMDPLPASLLNTANETTPTVLPGVSGTDPTKSLLAQLPALRPTPSPSLPSLVNSWTRVLSPAAGARPGVPLPPPSMRGVVPSSSPFVPVRPGFNPLGTVFSPGSSMITGVGVPKLSAPLAPSALETANAAFTPENTAKFERLGPQQQQFARGLLSAALEVLNQPTDNASRITPTQFREAVGSIMDAAGQYQPPQPAQNSALARPLPQPRAPSLTQPSSSSLTQLPDDSSATQPNTTPRPIVPNSTPSGQPTPSATSNPSNQPARYPYPTSGANDPAPTWWAEAVNGENGQQIALMVDQAKQLKLQADSIDVNRNGPSGQTPMTEWNTWKAA